MAPVVGLDHVQIAAPEGCEPEARRFYGELLGLAEIEKPEPLRARGGAWFRCGAQQLHVGVEKPFAPALKAHPAFAVTDLDELVATLERAGRDGHAGPRGAQVRRFSVAETGESLLAA